ncbi:hypothetical protein ACRRS0_08555 [Agarivorans sp. QJM3NY_29]|uniref:hypothetical protein n=1 Tax=unclassified Agarivorans TaxID=2636026 RepID=UPI003D7E0B99
MKLSKHKFSYLQQIAIVHIIAGLITMLLAYYVGTFSAIVLGLSIIAYAAVGLWFNQRLRKQLVKPIDHSSYWLFLAVGLLLTLFPGITLGLAALCLGGGLIIYGIQSFKGSRLNAGLLIWAKCRALFSILLGLVIILSGAAGLAWLIGMLFGLHIFFYGINLWMLSKA